MPVRFQVDGDFYDHPKTIGMSDGAVALWTRAGSYSASQFTDGFIPDAMLDRLSPTPEGAIHELLRRGLWKRSRGGYSFIRDNKSPFWRITRKGSRPWIPNKLRQAVYDRDGHRCVRCGSVERLSLDHIIPWSTGGRDTFENLRTFCLPCNWSRGARA